MEDHCQERCHAAAATVISAATSISSTIAAMDNVFASGGLLARHLPGFAARAGQLAMARAVATILDQADDESATLHRRNGSAPENRELTEYEFTECPEIKQSETNQSETNQNEIRQIEIKQTEIRQAYSARHLLLAEAGTGTGKTLAYLVPAALSGRKVVISTNTINLQEQILAKEIPFIRRYLAPGLKAICVKGRQNYLCLYRWHQLQVNPQGRLFSRAGAEGEEKTLTEIAAWLETTSSGDRAELSSLSDDSPLWAGLSAAADRCLGSSCAHRAECFITRLRGQAARAQLLIVNHHLFFSDLAVRRFGHAEVLPRYEAVIFDEAHHLENIATRYFGLSFSHYQVIDLVRDLEAMAEERLQAADRTRLLQAARSLEVEAGIFLNFFPHKRGRFPLIPLINEEPGWPQLCQSWQGAFSTVIRNLEELTKTAEIWGSSLRRCQDLLSAFKTVTSPPGFSPVPATIAPSSFSAATEAKAQAEAGEQNPAPPVIENGAVDAAGKPAITPKFSIYWYERREKSVQLVVSPIEVAGELRQHLYQQVKAAVLTSATLRTGNDFRYVKSRLGLPDDCPNLDLPTPFDYPGRTLLYVPGPDFPAPDQVQYPTAARREMAEIVRRSQGRALLLFTNISAMRQAAATLATTVPYPLLVQGEAPRALLLAEFRRRTRSILLAVASFWEGVDVPGESLSCVIIDKLPFEVPSDPVIMARIDQIKAEGGNPFFDFQVPRAVLMLRQGVGRLLRSDRDRGVLAILDVRLFTKGYGRTFRKSLPPSPLSRDLNEVKKFFGQAFNEES